MIWESIKVFTDVRKNQKIYADDSYDKLNRSTTVILLLIAAAMIVSNKLFSNQISCLDEPMKTIPVGMDYVNSLCLAKDTYTSVCYYFNLFIYLLIIFYRFLFYFKLRSIFMVGIQMIIRIKTFLIIRGCFLLFVRLHSFSTCLIYYGNRLLEIIIIITYQLT
jgi:hypothetical protein